jgi:hypothetical protein
VLFDVPPPLYTCCACVYPARRKNKIEIGVNNFFTISGIKSLALVKINNLSNRMILLSFI